ncbi:MAG: uroporphyrinogen-III synthase [Candidatus Dormibacteria bacterium]|jgi:uroporphyrinogen III methyltransferase/synthase
MTATPSRPLTGRRVLVTRAADQAAQLTQELRQLGATVIEVPAITIQPVASPDELRDAARSLRGHRPPRWMAVTSSNAAESLRALSLPEDLAGIRVAAVGEPTARALRDIGVNVELVAPGTGAGALADRLIGAGAGDGAIWLPQGEAARVELGDRLRQAGAAVAVTVCYRTVPVAGLRRLLIPVLAERVDAVTLLSPSAVEAVIDAVGAGALCGLSVVCVGSTTAAALGRHGLTAVVATRGDAEGVAAAVAGALRG